MKMGNEKGKKGDRMKKMGMREKGRECASRREGKKEKGRWEGRG